MVKFTYYKKPFYKKNYSLKATKRQFNYIASHYYKAKLSTTIRIKLDTSACNFLPNNQATYRIADLISSCPDWGLLKKMFQSYKLTGIALTIVPIPVQDQSLNVTTNTGTFPIAANAIVSAPAIGILTTYDENSYAEIIESDKSLILNFRNTIRKYWPFKVTDWQSSINTNQELGPVLAVNVQGVNTGGTAMWQIKCDFYITYRNRA